MNLTTFVFLSMLAVLPTNQKHVDLNKDLPRIKLFAGSIAKAVETNPNFVLFKGKAAKYAATTLLVATAWGESGFREDIQRCTKKGDSGRSITSFQMMKPWALSRRLRFVKEVKYKKKTVEIVVKDWLKIFTEEQLCTDSSIAAEQSLYMFNHLREFCPRGTMLNIWAGYGTGSCSKTQFKVIHDRCFLWQRLSKKMGLKHAYCQKNADITLDKKKLKDTAKKYKVQL